MSMNRSALKTKARALMQSVQPSVYLASFISLVVSWLLVYLSGRVSGMYELKQLILQAQDTSVLQTMLEEMLRNPRPLGKIIAFILEFMNAIWSVGFTIFCLRATRGRSVTLSNLMDGFAVILRLFILQLLMGIFVFLWSLLLFVPGIIASYRYSQAVYLLLDHPDWSPMRCIRESCLLMRGHKWQLFVLSLSFIGWVLLCAIPIALIWVIPYMELTFAEFYNRLVAWAPPASPAADEDDESIL